MVFAVASATVASAFTEMKVLVQIKRLADSRELLWNLTLRELRTKYRRSFLGWTWSLLNPLSSMLIYGFVFGVIFDAKPPVGDPSGLDSYFLYLLTGLLPWGFFGLVTNLGMGSLVGNAGLIRKVSFSRQTLVFAQSIFSVVQFGIEMSVLAVALLIFAGPTFVPWLPVTLVLIVLLAVFATGLGLVLAVSNAYFRDLTYLWTIVLQVYFFMTPVIFNPEVLRDRVSPVVMGCLEWHPMAVFIRSFRATLYHGTGPGVGEMVYLVTISVAVLIIGFAIFERFSRRLAEEL
jgi:ABC-type polysaccharide/polyol phosphate export permease